jgi:hypothetical protein
MPGGNRKGPEGGGALTGRGLGFCRGGDKLGNEPVTPGRGLRRGRGAGSGGGGGRGNGAGLGGGGRGRRGGGGRRAGPGGQCVCPECGRTQPHGAGAPCYQQNCPDCGAPLTRQD